MTHKHTPGPWMIGTYGPNGCYTVGTKQGLMTAMTAHSVNLPDQREQAIGNAKLIAAAPKLLTALEAVVAAARVSDAELALALDAARATIAKATS